MSSADTAQALRMAIAARQYPSLPLIHHSDRGLQYCSALYTNILKDNQIAISMTEQSDPYENAVAERINGILKDEFGLADRFEDIGQLQIQVEQSIEFYNNLRPHLSNQMLTPVQMHRQHQIPIKDYKKKDTDKYLGLLSVREQRLLARRMNTGTTVRNCKVTSD